MKTFQKLVTAGAITALSFGAALVAQERPAQPEAQSPQERAEQQSPQERAAQQRAQQEQQQQFGARAQQHNKASELKGSKLNTQAGESLGEVEDIAINLENGELAFLLVGAEGGQWKPVPPQAVTVQEQAGEIELTVDIDQQKWEQAPTVREEEIAQLTQEERGRQIYQFFGEDYEAHQQQLQFGSPDRQRQQQQQQQQSSQQQEQPQAQPSPQQQSGQQQEFGQQQQPRPGQRAGQQQQQQPGAQAQAGQQQQQQGQAKLGSKLMEAQIQNQQQQEIGQISDFLLNVQEGKVDFVLIEPEEQEGTFAVAPQAFQATGEDQVRLNVTQEDFQQAQELRPQEIAQQAQQARMMGAQARQDPQVFRFQAEEPGAVFGAPGREREEKKEEKAKERKERQEP